MGIINEFEKLIKNSTIDEINELKQHFDDRYEEIIRKYRIEKEEERLKLLHINKAIELESDELLDMAHNVKIIRSDYVNYGSFKESTFELMIGDINIYQYYKSDSVHLPVSYLSFNDYKITELIGLYNDLNLKVEYNKFYDFITFENKKYNKRLFK